MTSSSSRTSELRIHCSPEQVEVIADHLLQGDELGMLPDERHWIVSAVRKSTKAKILGADLDLENGIWVVTLAA